jgi:hypothetical protein
MSAEKGHPLAQAELGRLLVKGEGIARDKPRGLMWITIARDAFTAEKNPDNAEKISKLHGVVVDELSEQERKQTELLLENPCPKNPCPRLSTRFQRYVPFFICSFFIFPLKWLFVFYKRA